MNYEVGDVVESKDGNSYMLSEVAGQKQWTPVPAGTPSLTVKQKQLNNSYSQAYNHPNFDKKTDPNFALGLGRSATEGATLGWGDEIGLGAAATAKSAMSLLPGNETKNPAEIYKDMRSTYDYQQDNFKKLHPGANLVGNVTGGLGTGIGSYKAMANAPKLGGLMQTNPVWATGLTGAVEGGIAGAGYAKPDENIVNEALIGGLIGGVAGPTLYGAGKVVKPIAGYMGQKFKNMVPTTPNKEAAKVAGKFMSMDNTNPLDLVAKAQKMGSQATLADVAGSNTQSMAANVTMRPSGAKEQTVDFLVNRNKGSLNRVMGSLKKLSGGDDEYFKGIQGIVARRQEQAAPLYKEAFDNVSIDPNDMLPLIKGLKNTVGSSQNTSIGRSVGSVLKSLTKKANGATRVKYDLKELHMVKRDLDSKIGKAVRAGDNPLAAELQSTKKQLLEIMDGPNGDNAYAQARKIFSDESSLIDAMKAGRKILSEDADEMAWKMTGMSQAEKEAYISGATKSIRDKLMGRKTGTNVSQSISTPIIKERIKNMFDDPADYQKFIQSLDTEDAFFATANRTYGGSPTQPRQEAQKAVDKAYKGSAEIEGGDLGAMTVKTFQKMFGKELPEEVSAKLTKLMGTPVDDMTQADLKLLMKHLFKAKTPTLGANPTGAALGVTEGALSYR